MRKTVAIDLDGVLASQSTPWTGVEDFGDPISGSVEFTKTISQFADIVIHTARCNTELNRGYSIPLIRNMVKNWLDENGFIYHDIWIGEGKPIAAAYVDDRAVTCRPEENEDAYQTAAHLAKLLCGVPL